jgi:hypothetical protein
LLIALVCASIVARAAGPVKRATPPKFNKSVEETFFPDARQKLDGPRPQPSTTESPALAAPEARVASPPSEGHASVWSKLISGEAVEDEIKLQQQKLSEAVQSAPKFKAGDFRRARTALSVLATMFAIDAEYGQSIRWQRQAPAMRDHLARAGFNCKVGTDNSFKEAKACRESLEELIRGGTQPAEAAEAAWDKVADRAPLMQRLDQAQKLVLMPAVANAGEFSRRAEALEHEAQIVAALSEVMTQSGYEFADDDTYRQYAHDMQSQALAVRDAAAQKQYDAARAAVGEISKACSSCHEGYRN